MKNPQITAAAAGVGPGAKGISAARQEAGFRLSFNLWGEIVDTPNEA